TYRKTQGEGPLIVNHRCHAASPSRASTASQDCSVFHFRLSTVNCRLSSHPSSPALRNFASNVFGDTPNFSDARVLFHLHSRKVLSSNTRSICPNARPVTSSKLPSQLNCSGNIPA